MSANKKHGLGRGLEALLGEDDFNFSLNNIKMESDSVGDIKFVDINLLEPGVYQPRTEFNKEALASLAASIKDKGVLQPLLVRKNGGKYEIIAGERRWRAAKMANLNEIPVIEKDFENSEVLEVALIENLLRENLSAIEEAEGFNRLIIEFSHTHEMLSQIIGKSRSYITNTVRLLSLPAVVQDMVKQNQLSAGHARTLIGLENAEELARKIIAKNLSVRQTEEFINKIKNKQPTQKQPKNSNIKELEKDLTRRLGTKVKINTGKNDSGKITIAYKNPAELNAIIDMLENK